MERMCFIAQPLSIPPVELATFAFGEPALSQASWSKDAQALLIPVLRLSPQVVRGVATGGTLFKALNAVSLLQRKEHLARYNRALWSYVWGDLRVFETGEPVVTRAVFVRGKIDVPDLTTVRRYLDEMPKAS
jgi:hypothetical protein